MSAVRSNAVANSYTLTPKQRLALIVDTTFPTATILSMDDSEINHSFFQRHSFPASNINASGLTPLDLKTRGVSTADELVALGFDSLHLVNNVFCETAVAAYGAESLVNAFIRTSEDAVAVAGTRVVYQLGLTQNTLLQLCAGASIDALAVITQTPSDSLCGVAIGTLLDTGLRNRQLTSAGITHGAISKLVGTALEKQKLGY